MREPWWWVLALAMVVVPVRAEAAIVINEVLADPAGDANGDGIIHSTQDEFVELANTGAGAVSLDQWTLSDALQVRHNFDASSVIPAFGLFVIFGGLSLNNSGDIVTLRDAGGSLIDAFTFGAEGGQDTSLVRFPDGTGLFTLHTAANGAMFSPGLTLTGERHLPFPEPEPQPAPPGGAVVPEPATWMLMAGGLAALRRLRTSVETT